MLINHCKQNKPASCLFGLLSLAYLLQTLPSPVTLGNLVLPWCSSWQTKYLVQLCPFCLHFTEAPLPFSGARAFTLSWAHAYLLPPDMCGSGARYPPDLSLQPRVISGASQRSSEIAQFRGHQGMLFFVFCFFFTI